ncbi:MAG: AmmeMemoRadiSam system protein A [Sulfurimonadaceae bacterium]|nr:AmmeMemoRadiSam system protein A [Sulfurimonadaceae bacterium]
MVDPILLSIAKTSLLHRFDGDIFIDEVALYAKYPFVREDGACFVTLHKDKALRGCIGSITPHRSLFHDIYHNAQAAAFHDPRFAPLEEDELEHLTLEVSVLSIPKLLEYSDYEDLVSKIHPNKDGIILRHGRYQGTFLPQVWEQLPTTKEFLQQLSYKAGANPSIYNEHPEIYIYRVSAREEPFHAIQPL